MREKLFEYVANQYGINPDYPFSTAPTYAVLRTSGLHLLPMCPVKS